jgi:hypothetical protein
MRSNMRRTNRAFASPVNDAPPSCAA